MPRLLAIAAFCTVAAFGQLNFDTAHVNHFFPFIADGATSGGERWNTQFRFVNLNPVAAKVKLYLAKDSGVPVELDFGAVRSNAVVITIPANGTYTASTAGTSALGFSGWAWATSSVPVQATAITCLRRGESMLSETPVDGVRPALLYALTAQRQTVVSLGNIFIDPVAVRVSLRGGNGSLVAERNIQIDGSGRTAFTIPDLFPNAASDFVGNLRIEGATPDVFSSPAPLPSTERVRSRPFASHITATRRRSGTA
jgi:hypothetical protein